MAEPRVHAALHASNEPPPRVTSHLPASEEPPPRE
jgi:hypothetical protein